MYVQSFFEKNSYNDPDPLPFSGIYRPKNLNLNKYNKRVGILFYRTAWVDGDTKIVDEIIKNLMKGVFQAFQFLQMVLVIPPKT